MTDVRELVERANKYAPDPAHRIAAALENIALELAAANAIARRQTKATETLVQSLLEEAEEYADED